MSPPPFPHNLAPLHELRSTAGVKIDLAAPAVKYSRALAMFFMPRPPSLARGLLVSASRGTWGPIISKPRIITSVSLGRRASHRTCTAALTRTKGIYTLQDLIQKPLHQLSETDEFQQPHDNEYIGIYIQPMPIQHIKNKKYQDGNYEEVSCPL